jgi:hypothetical protein
VRGGVEREAADERRGLVGEVDDSSALDEEEHESRTQRPTDLEADREAPAVETSAAAGGRATPHSALMRRRLPRTPFR